MKLTAGQVYSASEAISRIAARLFPEFEVIAGQRNELIKKHGEKKDGQLKLEAVLPVEKDGVKSTVVNPAYALFLADLETLMAQEIEVDCPTVKLELLGDGETDVDLTALLPFIEEPVAPNPGAAKEV